MLHAVLHPKASKNDVRHQDGKSIIDLNFSKARAGQTFGLEKKESRRAELYHHMKGLKESAANSSIQLPGAYEKCGVTHLAHFWNPQGHKVDLQFYFSGMKIKKLFNIQHEFVPSSDFFRNAQSAQAVKWYFRATRAMALRLAVLFKRAWPAYYEKYRKAFDAGVWETSDPGPFLGRAIVWKLQVLPHRDGLDAGPAACFPVGCFAGGELYFPDLGLKLRYVFLFTF